MNILNPGLILASLVILGTGLVFLGCGIFTYIKYVEDKHEYHNTKYWNGECESIDSIINSTLNCDFDNNNECVIIHELYCTYQGMSNEITNITDTILVKTDENLNIILNEKNNKCATGELYTCYVEKDTENIQLNIEPFDDQQIYTGYFIAGSIILAIACVLCALAKNTDNIIDKDIDDKINKQKKLEKARLLVNENFGYRDNYIQPDYGEYKSSIIKIVISLILIAGLSGGFYGIYNALTIKKEDMMKFM